MNGPRPTTQQSNGDGFELLVIGLVAIFAVAGFVLWLGAQAASILHSHHHLAIDAQDVASALRRLPGTKGDPRLAFDEPARSQLPGPILFWICTVLAFAACVVVAYWGWQRFGSDRTPLDKRSRLGVPTQARLATARDLAALIVPRPQPGRFVLGRFGRRLLAAENPLLQRTRRRRWQGDIGSVALIGPSRSGKTRCAENGIRHWGMPAILSSVKTDLLAATIEERRGLGEVRVFDSTGVTGVPSAHWTPLRAAATLQGAAATAKALVDAAPPWRP